VGIALELVAGLFVVVSMEGLLVIPSLVPDELVSPEFDGCSLVGGLTGPD
jgi:hypothetical protein